MIPHWPVLTDNMTLLVKSLFSEQMYIWEWNITSPHLLLCSCFSNACLRKQGYAFTSLRGIWWIHTSLRPVSQRNQTVGSYKLSIFLNLEMCQSVSLVNIYIYISLCFKEEWYSIQVCAYIYLYIKSTSFLKKCLIIVEILGMNWYKLM